MALKFIFGPSGSGKSCQLYQEIIEASMAHPERSYIVLVPEQFTMQTQKDLVSMHPRKGIMNIDVLSFGRLAYRVFEETGGSSLPVLDDEGKNLILRKIAGDYEQDLKVLRGNMKKPGYISEVKSVLSEFVQYDIGEEELCRVMEETGEGSRLYYKLRDIGILYRGFTDYLEEKYITKEELLDVLSRLVKESEMLKDATVALDGFTGFTPVQNRLLGELMTHCRDVVVTVTMDEREDPWRYTHPYQLFALSKQMVTSLTRIAGKRKVTVLEPDFLYHPVPWRFRENRELAFLEHNLFRSGRNVWEEEPSAVGILRARNPREEAFAAAGKIRALVREEKIRYREIGVITSSMETYGDYLEEAFAAYGIPVFMDHKRSILLNPFIEYLRSLLDMAVQNFTYESVFRFLRTDLAGFTCEETDQLENYVIGLGIRGYKRWQERWVRRLKGMDEEELESLNHLRVLFVEKVDGLMYVLRQRRKTVQDITMALYEFMVREELQLRLKKQEEAFQAEGEMALAKEYAQIYRILIQLFEKFVELLGEEKVGLEEYGQLLDAGLEEARVGVIPPGVDQVVAGDMERTRLKDIKVLFFVGANDTHLPGALRRTGLLSERDREVFGREHLMLAPGGKEQAYIQKFYLYMNLTKPSERLEICYSKVSQDGKSLRPAYLIQEFRKLYPGLKVQDEEKQGIGAKELTAGAGVDWLIRGLQGEGAGMDPAWQELYTWYQKEPLWKAKADRLVEAGSYHCPEDGLTRRTAEKLYGEGFPDSITRMEQFSSCAYAHFMSYGLGLKERQEYEFEAVDLGNLCHSALELYSRKVEQTGKGWISTPKEEQEQYIRESVEEAAAGYGNSILYSSARNGSLLLRIQRMLERTVWALTRQLKAGDFRPAAYEQRFEGGKIDRVDLCREEDKIYVKVLDYKTGLKAFDPGALYYGLQLQLMVYMGAAVSREEKRHPECQVIPAGVFYYRIWDPLIDRKRGAGAEELEEAFLKELRPDGIVNLTEDALIHLDRTGAGESLAVPVKYNKDGSLSRTSRAVSGEDFRVMMDYAAEKIRESHRRILEGEIGPKPYRRGQDTGCDYCRYRHICGFDPKIPGYGYKDLWKLSREEALVRMRAFREDRRHLEEKRQEEG